MVGGVEVEDLSAVMGEDDTQKRRSSSRRLGLGLERLKTASCCLRARFSSASSRRFFNNETAVASIVLSVESMSDKGCVFTRNSSMISLVTSFEQGQHPWYTHGQKRLRSQSIDINRTRQVASIQTGA